MPTYRKETEVVGRYEDDGETYTIGGKLFEKELLPDEACAAPTRGLGLYQGKPGRFRIIVEFTPGEP